MDGTTRWHGICLGGPYNRKHITEHERSVRVAIDTDGKKPGVMRAIPAMQASSPHQKVWFGTYNWSDSQNAWIWDSASISETR